MKYSAQLRAETRTSIRRFYHVGHFSGVSPIKIEPANEQGTFLGPSNLVVNVLVAPTISVSVAFDPPLKMAIRD